VTELSAEAADDLARHWGDPDLNHASSLSDGAGFAILQQKDSVSLPGQLHVSKVVIQKPAGLKELFPRDLNRSVWTRVRHVQRLHSAPSGL
jgi:hypothetical protein